MNPLKKETEPNRLLFYQEGCVEAKEQTSGEFGSDSFMLAETGSFCLKSLVRLVQSFLNHKQNQYNVNRETGSVYRQFYHSCVSCKRLGSLIVPV